VCVAQKCNKIYEHIHVIRNQQHLHFSSVPAVTTSGKEHQCGNTTPVKNPAISVIDKLISLSPSPLKSCVISPTKQPAISPVREAVPASDREVFTLSC
jgi:hypothetical protein